MRVACEEDPRLTGVYTGRAAPFNIKRPADFCDVLAEDPNVDTLDYLG
jgi:hypothetical protein